MRHKNKIISSIAAMKKKGRLIKIFPLLAILLLAANAPAQAPAPGSSVALPEVPILLYHRFGQTPADSMTVTNQVFASHLEFIKNSGYTVIPLRTLVDFYLRKGAPPPANAVVIVVDDGHETVYKDMFPLVRKYRIPVTLFIYPSAISNASYAMTWNQLKELKQSGFFDIQSHTYWHPNFQKERRKLGLPEFEKFVDLQLTKSKIKLERELGAKIDMLAWPFGINDDYLAARAVQAGYVAAFTIERHSASTADNIMKLPRYLLTNNDKDKKFAWILMNKIK